jgi:hypothetical protein
VDLVEMMILQHKNCFFTAFSLQPAVRSKDVDLRAGLGEVFVVHRGVNCAMIGLSAEGSYHLQPLSPVSTWVGACTFMQAKRMNYFDYRSYRSIFARYQYELKTYFNHVTSFNFSKKCKF